MMNDEGANSRQLAMSYIERQHKWIKAVVDAAHNFSGIVYDHKNLINGMSKKLEEGDSDFADVQGYESDWKYV
jgi:hypothetical protein